MKDREWGEVKNLDDDEKEYDYNDKDPFYGDEFEGEDDDEEERIGFFS